MLRPALSKHRTEGKTVLYDAIEAGLQHLELAERAKRTLIVVTDGGDNASQHTLAQVMRAIEDSQTTIYTIGIADPDDPDRNPGVLQRIAAISGGESFLLDRYEDIDSDLQENRRWISASVTPSVTSPIAGTRKSACAESGSPQARRITGI